MKHFYFLAVAFVISLQMSIAAEQSENLIKNGGFDLPIETYNTPTPLGVGVWAIYLPQQDEQILTITHHSNEGYINMECTSQGSITDGYLVQSVSLDDSYESYKLSMDVKAIGDNPVRISAFLSPTSYIDQTTTLSRFDLAETTSGSWSNISSTIEAEGANSASRKYLCIKISGENQSVLIDNVTLYGIKKKKKDSDEDEEQEPESEEDPEGPEDPESGDNNGGGGNTGINGGATAGEQGEDPGINGEGGSNGPGCDGVPHLDDDDSKDPDSDNDDPDNDDPNNNDPDEDQDDNDDNDNSKPTLPDEVAEKLPKYILDAINLGQLKPGIVVLYFSLPDISFKTVTFFESGSEISKKGNTISDSGYIGYQVDAQTFTNGRFFYKAVNHDLLEQNKSNYNGKMIFDSEYKWVSIYYQTLPDGECKSYMGNFSTAIGCMQKGIDASQDPTLTFMAFTSTDVKVYKTKVEAVTLLPTFSIKDGELISFPEDNQKAEGCEMLIEFFKAMWGTGE